MNKKTLMFIVFCFICLCACGNEAPEENLTPTGYPTGEIQQSQVMYNGHIYYYSATGFDKPLPDGYMCVGTIENVDNLNEPEKDFHGARVELEQEVYASETNQNSLYLKYERGFAKFTIRQ